MTDPSKGPLKPAGPRQTQTYLRELLEANGLAPRRQLGQNFLIDLNLLDLLASSAQLTSKDVALEIGGGTGGLTVRLALVAGRVVTIEIDPGLYRLVQEETQHMHSVTLLQGDALQDKNHMNPELLAAVAKAIKEIDADGYHLAANLPYDVAAVVVANLLLEELPIRTMTMTVQFEVGERMIAKPGSKDFGPLSVLIQHVGKAEWIRTLGPGVFWPRPKVNSCILRITVDRTRRENLTETRSFHRFIRSLFLHRRKTLRSAIGSIPGYKALKQQFNEVYPRVGISGDVRAEQLSPKQLFDLYRAIHAIHPITVDEKALDDVEPESSTSIDE